MARRFKDAAARLRGKVASCAGETLVETLVATLIMSLVMLMLCTAIVSAAKINATAKASDENFNQSATDGSLPAGERVEAMSLTVTVKEQGDSGYQLSTATQQIDAYTQNGYLYNEPHKTDSGN